VKVLAYTHRQSAPHLITSDTNLGGMGTLCSLGQGWCHLPAKEQPP